MDQLNLGIGTRLQHTQHGPGVIVGIRYATYLISFIYHGIKEIDKNDHRGSAGSSYIELDGDIAIIAAGGGGSMVNIDALIALGGKPANYTEHSGNPPAEKLEKLTKIILSKKGI